MEKTYFVSLMKEPLILIKKMLKRSRNYSTVATTANRPVYYPPPSRRNRPKVRWCSLTLPPPSKLIAMTLLSIGPIC